MMPAKAYWTVWLALGLMLLSILLGLSLFWIFGAYNSALYVVFGAIFCFVLGVAMLLVGPLARLGSPLIPITVIVAGIVAWWRSDSTCAAIYGARPAYNCWMIQLAGIVAIIAGLVALMRVLQVLYLRRAGKSLPS
jgi:hypothetical protein